MKITNMKSLKFLILLIPLVISCNPEKVDTKGVQKELKEQKIKKVSEGEIISLSESIGEQIISKVQTEISFKLDSALKNGNFDSALKYCKLSNYPLVSRFEKEYELELTRTTFSNKWRNAKSTPDAYQIQILDAYSYNLENEIPSFNNVQEKDEKILFNAPILLNQQVCLRCHGTVGKDLTQKEYQTILAQYPQDKSINHKMNDFLGMWALKFSKRAIIKKM
jgi:hypothetical protein